MENYIAWRERMQKEGAFNHLTENQKAERYMEEQKGRSGFVKFIDNVGSNLLAGSHDLVAGIAGTAGLLTGSKAASEFAAEKAEQAERTTAALQHTGNDGLGNSIVGGVTRALPGMAATAATGGALGTASKAVGLLGNGARVTQVANALNTAANSAKVARVVNAATAFTQTAGTTYADLYKHHRELGLSHEAASQKAAGASMVSGAVSAALGGISLGGAQALSNPATREAAKKSFGEAMKTFLKGSGKEMTQEALDSGVNTIASEMNKGKTLKAAAATAFEQLPETLTTAGAMGGGVETAAHLIQGTQWDHHDSASAAAPQTHTPGGAATPAPGEQGEAGGKPQAASAGSQQGIPQTATPSEPGTAPPAKIPVPTLDEAIAAKQTAEKLKAKKGPLSPEQQQAQDAAEKTFARKVEDNILKQQAGIERRGGKLHPTAAKALADAQAVLARRGPGGSPDGPVNADNIISYHSNGTDANTKEDGMPGQTGNGQQGGVPVSTQQPSTTANNRQPPQTSPLPPPRTPPLSVEQSRRLIENVAQMHPEMQQHPQVQADLTQAQRVVAGARPSADGGGISSGNGLKTNQPFSSRNDIRQRTATSSGQPSKKAVPSRSEPNVATHVVGAGAYPTVRWNPNPEGTPVRTPEQAEAIAKDHGVHIPRWAKFRPVPSEFYGKDQWAQYCYFCPSTTHVSWKMLLEPDGTFSIGFDERLLHSDEGIVGIFAHEMHEVNALYEILQHDDVISLASLERLIQPPHGKLHQQAWSISDEKINQMRKTGYDARAHKL